LKKWSRHSVTVIPDSLDDVGAQARQSTLAFPTIYARMLAVRKDRQSKQPLTGV